MWVKICGVRDELTADQVCRLAPDAIGLNFYAKSPRVVSRDIAIRIADISGDQVQRIGVFVNHPVSEIVDLVAACKLNAVQVHGDESTAEIAELSRQISGVPIYRAWRMDGESLAGLAEHLIECDALGIRFSGCLIDARVPGAFGGTGHTVPWEPLTCEYLRDHWPPLILAGGLNSQNVGSAIRVVRPWGVDVASGVENAPGSKDLDQVRRFIENARTA